MTEEEKKRAKEDKKEKKQKAEEKMLGNIMARNKIDQAKKAEK